MGIFDKFKKKVKNNETVLNIERTNTIDGIAYNEKDLKLVLLLADGMDWHDEKNHLLLLQEKINNYISYIEGKQYLQKYSNVEQIEIQIKFLFKETDNCRKFLEQVEKIISTSLNNTSINMEYGTEETYE